MKYITYRERGWDHRPYWDYLESVKTVMPAHLFAFASNIENHDLQSPNSLHDSWLDYWRIEETADNGPKDRRALQIEARLFGQRRDRRIYMTYKSVTKYEIQSPREFVLAPISTPPIQILDKLYPVD